MAPLAGRSFSDEEIVATFGPSEEGTIRALVPEHYDEGITRYLQIYDRLMIQEDGPFPGIIEWLDGLKTSGIKLGLVTGKGPGSANLTLSRFNLTRFFDHIATGSPAGIVKKERICEMIKLWGLPAEQVVYVGDSPNDVTAAREAGVRMIAAAWSPTSDIQLEQIRSLAPDFVASSIEEANAWIQLQNGPRVR
jgi:phosphoglycolate phosphatase/pyrophosphatase PpaX